MTFWFTPVQFSACAANPANALKLNLRFSLIQDPTLPHVSTPCSCSSSGLVPRSSTPPVQRFLTPSVPRISTFSVNLFVRKALVSSLTVAVLVPLSVPFRSLDL